MSQRQRTPDSRPTDSDGGDSQAWGGPAGARGSKRELVEELRAAGEGAPLASAESLPRGPAAPNDNPDTASLLFEDFLRRRGRGEDTSLEEYRECPAEPADSLVQLFQQQAVLRSLGVSGSETALTRALPAVGDQIFHFRLCRELGRGAFARVFLAEQVDLAGRPVVLKVSGITGKEPQTLAQLQHTYIVPIYSVHEDTQTGLRAVCMPYFGGASLSQLLHLLWADSRPPVEGAQLVEALDNSGVRDQGSGDRVAGPDPCPLTPDSWSRGSEGACEAPAHRLLRTSTYLRAAVWIVARVAEGLHHAHQRGVLHRDIKPSNILLSAEGQPMLLDFNLAQNLNDDQAQAAAALGGTIAYMAPEHLRAMVSRDAALTRRVDHRADIYSLGMVLYEMLAGQGPFQQSASYSLLPVVIEAMALERSQKVPSLRQRRPDIPWSLESIVRKCLAPDPAQRYQQAEHLAEDLQAFLDDRPLKHAPELSRAERLAKWFRRHPRLTSSGTVAAAAALLLTAAIAAWAGVRQHLSQTREQLAAVEALQRARDFEHDAVRAVCLINTTTDLPDYATASPAGTDHFVRGREICEKALGRYGVLDRADWQEHPAWRRLESGERLRQAEAVRELLLLLAWARLEIWQRDHSPPHPSPPLGERGRTLIPLAPVTGERDEGVPSREQVIRDALALLARAEAIPDLPPSPALWEDRAYYLGLLGDAAGSEAAARRAAEIPPASARDYYLLALARCRKCPPNDSAARRAAAAAALKELDQAVRLNDRHYWSWLQRGICHLDLEDAATAAGDFGVCIGLWPEHAWGYFNRGLALSRLGKNAEAVADYTAALERDPSLARVYLNRGLARLELQQYAGALADFDQAARLGLDEMAIHAGRGMALERLGRPTDADAAFDRAWARAASASAEVRLRLRWTYGFTVAARLPDQAREAFRDVLRHEPNESHALYGLAMLAAEQNRIDEAIGLFDRALEASPSFVAARRFRAVLLARRGDLQAAERDIDWCLRQEPGSGITLYAAACVVALAAGHADPWRAQALADRAITFLQKAFAAGYGQDKAATDPDLAAIRGHPEFKELLREASGRCEPAGAGETQ